MRTYRVVWTPVVGHHSEDGLGGGLEALLPFALDPSGLSPLSEIRGSVYYSTKNHKEFSAETSLYWGQGRYHGSAKFHYDDLAQRFWGIGSTNAGGTGEVYRPRETRFYGEVYRTISRGFRLGLRAEYHAWDLISSDPRGEFAGGGVPGQDSSEVLGGGLLMDWDTRDRRYQPTAGFRLQGFALSFVDQLGADHRFSAYNLEWRGYHGLGDGHVLATQAFCYAALDDPPFWRLAELGGRHHSRGYRQGRYRDRTMVASQLEWRFPLFAALRGVVFGGVATVTNDFASLQSRYLRPTLGTGFRYVVGAGGKSIPIRVDVAMGTYGVQGYLGIGEAF
jgi:hypothetical protein